MAANKQVFAYSKNQRPGTFAGLVQAGSTATIKAGEICVLDKTSGYWIPASAVADFKYPLAIAMEEQKSDDLARFMGFYDCGPDDVFEFDLSAASAIAPGDTCILVASQSQQLAVSTSGQPVAIVEENSNWPASGTTRQSRSRALVSFLPNVSAWGDQHPGFGMGKIRTLTGSETLLANECYGGTIFIGVTGTITLPAVQVGMDLTVYVTAATVVYVDPDDDDRVTLAGTAGTDGYYVACTAAAGSWIHLKADSAAGWTEVGQNGTWAAQS